MKYFILIIVHGVDKDGVVALHYAIGEWGRHYGCLIPYTATKENTDVLASCLEPFDTYKEE